MMASVQKLVLFCFPFLLFLESCVSRRASASLLTHKYAPEVLHKDLSLLQQILEANHPSLYWYTPKDSMDHYFRCIQASISDSLTEAQFKNKVAWVVSKIRCGHTAVRFSNKYTRAALATERPQFPLFIKTWGDSMVVTASYFRKDSIFKRGTILTGINNRGCHELLDSMFQLISTDGNAINFKSQVISINFPAYYRNTFGLSEVYTIRYLDSAGKERTAQVNNYDPKADTLKEQGAPVLRAPAHVPPLTKKELRQAELNTKRSLVIDTTRSTAYLRLTTFSEGHLRRFFRQTFGLLKKDSIRNLILDLRENGGGSIALSTKLARYLADHPFKDADTVAAKSRRLRYGRYIHPSWVYWLSMRFSSRRMQDGRYHFRYYEKHVFPPQQHLHFSGHVYVLQGGYTFSAASMLVSTLKGQPNVTVAGEETGGGSYGNSSVHLPSIQLPATGIKVVLPLYRLVLNHEQPNTGHGIIPDLLIPPSSQAIRRGVDPKMETIQGRLDAERIKQR